MNIEEKPNLQVCPCCGYLVTVSAPHICGKPVSMNPRYRPVIGKPHLLALNPPGQRLAEKLKQQFTDASKRGSVNHR